jgi:hypothetical protein
MTSISQYIPDVHSLPSISQTEKKVYEVYELDHQLKEKTLFLKPPSSYKLVSFISGSW